MVFTPALFDFLRELKGNNNRDWFQTNKSRYEKDVKDPLLLFIADFADRVPEISPHIAAIPRATGGSMFRIYRDMRFSKDKTPYKTAAALHFRHESGKDVHAPGYYLHLEPGSVFMGAGIWKPDGETVEVYLWALGSGSRMGKRWLKSAPGLTLNKLNGGKQSVMKPSVLHSAWKGIHSKDRRADMIRIIRSF